MADKKPSPHKGHRSRIRKQFIKNGADTFYPHQLLELLLFYPLAQKDTNDLAHKLLDHFGSFDKVFTSPISRLTEVSGVGIETATFLRAVYDLYHVHGRIESPEKLIVDNIFSADVYYSTVFHRACGEQFAVTSLDNDSAIDFTDIIESADSTRESRFENIRPAIRRIIETVINSGRSNFTIAHFIPSDEYVIDKEAAIAKEICAVLDKLGVNIMQYYFINDEQIVSFIAEESL